MKRCMEFEKLLNEIDERIREMKIMSGNKMTTLMELEIALSNTFSEYEVCSEKYCKNNEDSE